MLQFARKMTNKFKRKAHSKSKRNDNKPHNFQQAINPLIPSNEILPENVTVPNENKEFNKNNYGILRRYINSQKKQKQFDEKKNQKEKRLLNYGASTRENLIYVTLQELNREIGNKAAVNFYRSVILTGTMVTVTGLISTALAATVILAPLAAVVGVVSTKLNDYLQTKYLWTTNKKDSFSDIDLETLMNVSKLYYRILLSPFLVKVLKKHAMLFKHGNYALGVIKRHPNRHQEVIAQNWENEKQFDEEYNISGWVEHQMVHSVERLSNVVEKIYELDLVTGKTQFQELYNLFMAHLTQTKLFIELHQTSYDVLQWRSDIEEKEKQVAIESAKLINEEFDRISQSSNIRHWFSRATTDRYRLNKTDLHKVLELMK